MATIPNKMYNPQLDLRRKWNAVLAIVKSASGSPPKGPATRSRDEIVLELTESPQQADTRRAYHAADHVRALARKHLAVNAVRAAAPGDILGRTVYLNDPELPWEQRFIPQDFRR